MTATAKDSDGNEVSGTTSLRVVDDGRRAPRIAGAVPDAERRFALAAASSDKDDDGGSSSVGIVVAAVVAVLAVVTTAVLLRRRRGSAQKA